MSHIREDEIGRERELAGAARWSVFFQGTLQVSPLRELIKSEPELAQCSDASGWYPLAWACRVQDIKESNERENSLICELLEAYPSAASIAASQTAASGCFPIHYFLRYSPLASPATLAALLRASGGAAATREEYERLETIDRWTPLHYACFYSRSPSNVAAVIRCCPSWASVRTRDTNSVPLRLLVRNKNLNSSEDLVALLLSAHAQAAEVVMENGRFPLHEACESSASAGVIELLIRAFPDACYRGTKGSMAAPFHAACYSHESSEPRPGCDAVVNVLLGLRPSLALTPPPTQMADESHQSVSMGPTEATPVAAAIRTPAIPIEPTVAAIRPVEGPAMAAAASSEAVSEAASAILPVSPGDAFRVVDTDRVVRLLANGEYTPLHVAIKYRAPLPVVQKLLCAWPGAVEARSSLGQWPAHLLLAQQQPGDAPLIAAMLLAGGGSEYDRPVLRTRDPVSGKFFATAIAALGNADAVDAALAGDAPLANICSADNLRLRLPHETGFTWHTIIGHEANGNSFAPLLEALLVRVSASMATVRALMASRDAAGRSLYEVAAPACKDVLSARVRIARRYELCGVEPLHRSATSVVYSAMDFGEPTTSSEGVAGATSAAVAIPSPLKHLEGPRPVVLKFIRAQMHWQREQTMRDLLGDTTGEAVLPILAALDGRRRAGGSSSSGCAAGSTAEPRHDAAFDAIRCGFGETPFLLALPAADATLQSMMVHQQLAQNVAEVRRVAKELTACLAALHKRGIVHGDIKPLNIVRVGTAYLLIDLDASVSFARLEMASDKTSSAYLSPERIAATTALSLLVASPAQDAWALGATLFQLVTGSTIFNASADGMLASVPAGQAEQLSNWSDEKRDAVLAAVTDRSARNLIGRLLVRDSACRMLPADALRHSWLSGVPMARSDGEDPLHQVFLSYRVAADKEEAEGLYQRLTAAGISVWWDAKSLRLGEHWRDAFCRSLAASRLFVPLISAAAIESWRGSPGAEDNLLLEHRLALELREMGIIGRDDICPIFIGRPADAATVAAAVVAAAAANGAAAGDAAAAAATAAASTAAAATKGQYVKYFAGSVTPQSLLCADAHAGVEAHLRVQLEKLGYGTPMSPDSERSSRAVARTMHDLQGHALEGPAAAALDKAADAIIRRLEPAASPGPSLLTPTTPANATPIRGSGSGSGSSNSGGGGGGGSAGCGDCCSRSAGASCDVLAFDALKRELQLVRDALDRAQKELKDAKAKDDAIANTVSPSAPA